MTNSLDRIANLSPEKRALLLRRLNEQGGAAPSRIPRRERPWERAPLSFAQQRLWFLNQLAPDLPFYNESITVHLEGALDIAALARSLDAVVARHETLRTTFQLQDGEPAQVVAPRLMIALPVAELLALPAQEREATALRIATTVARQPFDLQRGPLLRALLLRTRPDAHLLVLVLHHIISDGWSLHVLIREMTTLYVSYVRGQPARLAELPIQYADYALWQREYLQGSEVRRQGDKETRRQGDKEPGASDSPIPNPQSPIPNPHPPSPIPHPPSPLQAQLAYWKRQLQGAQPALDLPADRPRPPVQTYRGARHALELPPALVAALRQLGVGAEATPFQTLLAAFQTLLHRYTGQEDLLVGSPIAGRTRAETESLIGFFVNTLVLRADLSGDPTFRAYLRRVRDTTMAAYTHQELPFEKLVEELQPERNMSRTPFFQVMFVLLPHPALDLGHAGLIVQQYELDSGTAKFDLTLHLWEQPDTLHGWFEYNTDLFEAATIARMAVHFQTLLAGIAAAPDQRLSALPLLSEPERRQLLTDWNATARPYPEQCLHELVATQAARSPDAIAVVFDGRSTNDQRPTTNDQRPTTNDRRSRIDDLPSSILHPPSRVLSPQSSVLSPEHLTYGELNVRANRLAHHLRALGVGPDVSVGICMERSSELVVGLLGILKAGAAYVPLDPDYPPDRLAFMLEDSQAAVLITTTVGTDKETRPAPSGNEGRQGLPRVGTRGDKALQEPRTKNQEPHDCENQEPGTDGELETQNSKLKTQNCTPSPCHLVTLSESWPAIAAKPPDNPACRTRPENLAYVIYTSGSTGTPKGAMNEHRAVVNRILWMQDTYRLDATDRVLQKTPFSFDVSVWEFFWPLVTGAQLVLARPGGHKDSGYLADLIATHQITVLHFVPSMLQIFLEEPDLTRCTSLRHVICSGEALPASAVQRFFARLDAALHNLYGPTEAAIDVTSWVCERDSGLGAVPIGRPIANVQLYVLDRHQWPVPVGVPGELHIGGVAPARGYLNRPELTAERFIPNPFAGVTGDGCWVLEDSVPNTQHPSPNTRLYKTGDLVRYRSDGAIEFLGRLDQQVKLRGFRIELGEVESALGAHPAVLKSAVLLREDTPGEARLVAYVVPDQRPTTNDQRLTTDEMTDSEPDRPSSFVVRRSSFVDMLHTFLRKRLPTYMVPSAFVMLERLPLTPSGKVDRRALPAPDRSSDAEMAYVAPRGPIEDLLAGIWADLLHRDRVGIYDDFFALGGHSLLATQVASRVRGAFHVDLPLRTLFEATSVAALARQIEAALNSAEATSAPLRPQARGSQVPVSFAQQRLWFLDQLAPGNPFYNMPAAIRVQGRLDVGALQGSLNALVARHETLRTRFALLDDQPVQVIAPRGELALRWGDLTALPAAVREAEVRRLAQEEAEQPFDLTRGPLIRATALRLDGAEHVLLLTMHHIISDGWSIGVLIRELAQLYRALSAGQTPDLPPLPVQYADFALWQRAWLQGSGVRGQGAGVGKHGDTETRRHGDKEQEASGPPSPNTQHPTPLQVQVAYWRRQLANLPGLALPTDRARPPVQRFAGAQERFTVAPAARERLEALSRQTGITLFMTLLTAFQLLLARYSSQDDIVVGTPIANRTRAEIEGLIGFFVNTLVVRTDLSGVPTARQALQRVRQVLLDAYTHQDVPFERLVEELQPERSLSHNPLFQVMFALQNAFSWSVELPDARLQLLDIQQQTAKFDLGLDFREAQGGLEGVLMYSTDLFDATTIQRMIGHIQTLLESISASPDRRIADLPLLTEAERRTIAAWNATQTDFPTAVCAYQLFEAQAAHSPDAVAVIFAGPPTTDHRPPTTDRSPLHPLTPSPLQRLTYRELNRRANRLAHDLRARGVGPEVLVAVCTERSPDLIIGLLAIMKAGGAYLPLDPSYPAERLAFMLQDSRPALVLVDDPQKARTIAGEDMHASAGVEWIDIAAGWLAIARAPATNPPPIAMSHHAAYLIYTSGSTGTPKAVVVEHRNLANVLFASRRQFGFGADDVMPWIASAAFDISLFELLNPLVNGGALLCLTRQDVLETESLVAVLDEVTRIHTVPSLMRQLVNAITAHGLRPPYAQLRTIFIGGDRVPPQLLKVMREIFPQTQIEVLYGPTEATIICSHHTVSREQVPDKQLIGTPLHNVVLQIYDEHLQLVPVGVPGEVYIAGAGVTRGYLGRPDLTGERFVPNPFAEGMGDKRSAGGGLGWGMGSEAPIPHPPSPIPRLYRTSDRARWLPDGMIEFLGRVDQQVKVRGFRIEPGEIEAVLSDHPAVRESVVIARDAEADEKRLVAYLVRDPHYQDDAQQATISTWSAEQVDRWQMVFDETHRRPASLPDPTFNIAGWNSSYTNSPIPTEEMRAWVDQTVERIQSLRPRRILEIGCGTGLLLFRLAQDCQEYYATDFANGPLRSLRQQMAALGWELPHVSLHQRPASDFSGLEPGHFDLIVLNSVAQYFPGVEYLARVLEAAARVVAPGGHIFVGDLRSYPLLEAFHTSVQLHHAPDDLARAELRRDIHKRMGEEEELLVDPAFFSVLMGAVPRISGVQVQLKRGKRHNELTRFRYDVTIAVDGPRAVPPALVLDWRDDGLTVAQVRRRLLMALPESLRVTGVPNARLAADVAAVEALALPNGPATAAGLRDTLRDAQPIAVDPEDWWVLEDELPYTVTVGWSGSGADGRYDVTFTHCAADGLVVGAGDDQAGRVSAQGPIAFGGYANNPLQGKFAGVMVPQLRRFLQARLPDYMIPSAFVLLSALPLTSNGKVDQQALPEPDRLRPTLESEFVAPRTPMEEVLERICADVLGLDQVGIYDNFFDLGGHSLLATQIVSRIRDAFQIEIPLRRLFETPTVAGVAEAIIQHQIEQASATQIAAALEDLDQFSDEEIEALLASELESLQSPPQ